MKAQYLNNKKQWTAFTTINGLDIQEYGDTEAKARENLANRIANSEFLLQGIKTEKTPKVGDTVFVDRQIGKNGAPNRVEGIIKRFSKTMTIGGEKTVEVVYKNGGSYYYPISKLILL